MEKVILFDGKETAFRSSGATAILYKQAFKKDLLVEISKWRKNVKRIQENEEATEEERLENSLEFLEITQRLAFIMNLEATDKALFNKLSYEKFISWLMSLSGDAFGDKDVNLEIFSIWSKSTEGTSNSKN